MDIKELVFATNNIHKLEEVSFILKNNIHLLSLKDISCDVDIPETADTLEGNALLKAEYIYKNYGINCFADDTGLEISALGNRPGVHSARYSGEDKNPEANIQKVLEELEGITNRNARFRTVIHLILDGNNYSFEGIVNGKIIDRKKGISGFGYDPIFIPDGFNETFAEMGNEIKNKISHRAIAINRLCDFLNKTKS